jgi:hypothetical protein
MRLEDPGVWMVTTTSGLVQATALLLALAPPAAYVDWVGRTRAA